MCGNLANYRYLFEYSYYYTAVGSEEEIASTVYDQSSYDDFEIYSTYKKEYILSEFDNFAVGILNETAHYENIMYFVLPIASVFVVIIVTYLIVAIGHTKEKEGIDVNDLDRIPLEILIIIMLLIGTIGIAIWTTFGMSRMEEYYKLMISGIVTSYFVIYTAVAIVVTTIIKRIKAKMLMDTSIIGKIIKWLGRIINKIDKALNIFTSSMKNTWRLIFYAGAYAIIMVLVLAIFSQDGSVLGVLIDIGITIYVFYQIMRRINSFEKIENHLKEIYEGNNSEKLNPEEVCKEFKNMANYINDISNGFENAIQEGIKSERLKTELITNVSHDIKTPLTSIINYVDLLKQENIDNEKAKEYIEILEAKSLRLKRLTEDLVEASKASSGNVKLNLEKINIGELINQTTGEFEDRFKESGLEVITSIPEENIFIEADSRYMYRVIENLFSNISKYAAKNSRVYIDISLYESKVNIEIKNISADKLNISTEELMQRFVRGDKSRTTEGSGLRTINIKRLDSITKR